MTLRKRHGNAVRFGTGRVVETPPADELGQGRPATMPADARQERAAGGRFAPGNRTSAAGGRGKRAKVALARRVGIGDLEPLAEFAPYLEAARALARVHRATLREEVAGGASNAAIDSVVVTASWQRAASDFLFAEAARTGDPELFVRASRLGDSSRQSFLAAWHMAELAAKARPAALPPLWLDAPAEAPARPAEPADDAPASDALAAESPEDGRQ